VTQQLVTTRPPRAARAGFWVIAALGPLASVLSWIWYAMAQFEAQSEQCKALAADTTMAGFAELWGGVPLVAAHLVGLVVLVPLGWRAYGRRGIAMAIAAVLVASVIGVAVAQFLAEGALFELGVDNTACLS
jgi:hypothetical protein